MPAADLNAAFADSSLVRELEEIEADRRAFPTSQAKRHHFVPRFLLAGFVRAGVGRERLCQLDVRTGRPSPIKPEEAASRRRFYSLLDEDGTPNNRLEAFLAIVESHAARAFKLLIRDPAVVPDGDRATIAIFLSLLAGRTPGANDYVRAIDDTLMRMLFANHFNDQKGFAEVYREAIGDASHEDVERLRLRMIEDLEHDRIKFSDPKGEALRLTLELTDDVAAAIYALDWTVLRSENRDFITSDRGLAMHDPTPIYPWSEQAWHSSPNATTTIPLARDACLLLVPGDIQTVGATAQSDQVDEINLRTYGWASDYIYGSNQQVVSEVRRLAKREPSRVVRPKPHRQVTLIEIDPSDRSLAQANARRGWPPYIVAEGAPHDYIVHEQGMSAVEVATRGSDIARARAIRKHGTEDLQAGVRIVDPSDL